MSDIQDYIQKLGDDTLSIEEQAATLQEIEQSLLESQAKQEEIVQSSTDLVVEAIKTIEDTVYTQFKELSTSESMKGPKGDRGLDGKNGKDGKDGIGRDGRDGKDGKDGIDGEDGRYITDIEVDIDDTLLVTLSDNTTLKTSKDIKGPKGDQGPQGLRGSNGNGVVVGGSTGQVLAKASNIDYDVTWIAASTGSGTVTSITAGTGLSGGTITGSGTIAIDSTVATLTGSQTLTNKTLTSPVVNTPAITGGTIDNTVIGGTTPAAGTFTTITGQTEVLKGTGTNLLLRSQALTTGPWGLNAAPTTASYTDPLGGSTAIQFTTSANNSGVYQAYTAVSNLTYTFSFYIKYLQS